MKEVVFFDVDNTLVKGQSQLLLINFLYNKNYIGLFFYIKIYIWFILYKLNLISNPLKIMEYAFSFVKGKKVEEIDMVVNYFVNEILSKYFYDDALRIINKHKLHKREIVIISNAVDILIKKICQKIEVDNFLSTTLEVVNGNYTAKIVGDIVYGEKKVVVFKKYLENHNLSLENIWGYSDHHSDIPILTMCKYPYAVNPTKELKKVALESNWNIIYFKK